MGDKNSFLISYYLIAGNEHLSALCSAGHRPFGRGKLGGASVRVWELWAGLREERLPPGLAQLQGACRGPSSSTYCVTPAVSKGTSALPIWLYVNIYQLFLPLPRLLGLLSSK